MQANRVLEESASGFHTHMNHPGILLENTDFDSADLGWGPILCKFSSLLGDSKTAHPQALVSVTRNFTTQRDLFIWEVWRHTHTHTHTYTPHVCMRVHTHTHKLKNFTILFSSKNPKISKKISVFQVLRKGTAFLILPSLAARALAVCSLNEGIVLCS